MFPNIFWFIDWSFSIWGQSSSNSRKRKSLNFIRITWNRIYILLNNLSRRCSISALTVNQYGEKVSRARPTEQPIPLNTKSFKELYGWCGIQVDIQRRIHTIAYMTLPCPLLLKLGHRDPIKLQINQTFRNCESAHEHGSHYSPDERIHSMSVEYDLMCKPPF